MTWVVFFVFILLCLVLLQWVGKWKPYFHSLHFSHHAVPATLPCDFAGSFLLLAGHFPGLHCSGAVCSHSPLAEHLACFHCSAVINDASTNTFPLVPWFGLSHCSSLEFLPNACASLSIWTRLSTRSVSREAESSSPALI